MAKSNKSTLSLDEQIKKYKNEIMDFHKMRKSYEPKFNNSDSPYLSYREYAEEHPKQGKMKIQTFTARRTYPVLNAVVEISKTFPNGKYIIATLSTDESGMTQEIILPTAEKTLSEYPGEKQPYSTFDVTVTHPDFIEVRVRSIPVFQDVTSMQTVDMTPKSVQQDGQDYIEYTIEQPYNL